MVSDPSRGVDRYTLPCILNTADTSEGSSGGALFNEYGQVIGITSGAYRDGNGMYLAVPIDAVLTADLTGEGRPSGRYVRSCTWSRWKFRKHAKKSLPVGKALFRSV